MTDDFFPSRLDTMIDLHHPFAVLATRMPWAQIEASAAPLFAHRDRAGVVTEGIDLFGTAPQLAGAGVSTAGRPRLRIRLMHRQLEQMATYPTIRLALRLIWLTMVRKSELIEAT
ncbi:integrase [Burkholderia lata]|nr:integrase [Burkholderia lata]